MHEMSCFLRLASRFLYSGGQLITPPGNWASLRPANVHYLALVTCFFQKPAVMIGAGIAVGLPVTRQPPHRSRRAVFSHRALQKYSLPHSDLSRRSCPSRFRSSYNPWPLYVEELYQLLEASPVVAAALTASVEPLEEDA